MGIDSNSIHTNVASLVGRFTEWHEGWLHKINIIKFHVDWVYSIRVVKVIVITFAVCIAERKVRKIDFGGKISE
jgi:hypothetical protein